MLTLADTHARRIEGCGTPDHVWQSWPGLNELPAISAHALVPLGARAVIVAPHPDDEILACGGLLQLLAAQGSELLFVAVTDGDASHPGSPLWPQERLRQVRPQESALALQALGLALPAWLRLHLPDGGVAGRTPQLSATLAAQLRPGDIVFTTWRLDGHPDHEACGWACASACSASGATLVEMPVWGWHWAVPGDARVPWHRARRLPLPAPLLQRKRAALRCFASQMQDDPSTGSPAIVAGDALQRLLHAWEVYFL
ncbi:1D-myo-inositol 2-acetamido-2-deoxy-alpha-D-glucopyranoside deacetylase [Janthinobacterium sp. HH103]|uniref:PIG-L deacetylase family protein n=1 Tax=unclassified Janthinobacterium TaxID=2610881 RepID=UPI0008742561|nr:MULTISPECIES: PIG-L family deacetylase [unclassified Janthinobacterium]OEZ64651.1 1D-myo-inositol 2-acetamido-2-deoxy-alpha-D-glucopyranoside deacetylase [Janthinobacterium sp. HH100]OEZ84089.1 1D-myo-inositol 2-acetamido-2-deoxy-alpha-D-glucopyranoside deacetylase [Janthinobacterium sp. HH103]QOU74908.1 GlcNAc-PI de-N-acetylase [Janthinobacterium sp. HH102]